MRVGIYTRVSQARGAQKGKSTGDQEHECREDIADNVPDAVIAAVYCDDDRGASRYSKQQRPDWNRLLSDLRAHNLDMLTTWEASRAQRDLEVYVELRKICREHGILWRYDGRTYDMADDEDAYRTGQDALDAEREAAKIRKRVLRGVRSRARAGAPHGRHLYGYQREYDVDPRGRRVYLRTVPHPDQAPIVVEVFRRYADGAAVTGLGRELDRRGVPTPHAGSRWYQSTLRAMLANEGYRGSRTSKAGHATVQEAWPALVDEATWDRCQARLNDPDAPRQDNTVRHLLSGICECGVCGQRMAWHCGRSTRDGKVYEYPLYTCNSNGCLGRSAAGVEHDVLGFVFGMWDDEDRVRSGSGDDPDLAALEGEHAALVARLAMWQDSAGEEGVTPASIAKAEQKLLPQIAAVERRLAVARAGAKLPRVNGPLSKVWGGLGLPLQREIIAASVRIVVKPTGKGKRYSSDSVEIEPRW